MPAIVCQTITVYHAPTKGRRYFTARAAANQEAGALLSRKYPTEPEQRSDFGRIESASWHWSQDERLRLVRDRLARRILNRLKGA